MSKNNKVTLSILVSVVVLAFLVQLGRFINQYQKQPSGTSRKLTAGYFPFNVTISKPIKIATRGRVCSCPDGSTGFQSGGICKC